MQDFSRQDAAQARSSAYTLLSRLFLEGVSAEIHPYLNAIPNLSLQPFNHDEAAAAHHRLFQHTLIPNESIFLDTTGLLGGDLADAIARQYADAGFAAHDDADHIGGELAMLAFLCGAEADAWEDDMPRIAQRIRKQQQRFMQQHLLRWLPPFVIALQQQGDALYGQVSELLWSLMGEHFAEIGEAVQAWELDAAHDLNGEDISLKDIANFLGTPAWSGWWFGRGEIEKIGRKLNLPRGFGPRIQMTMNLFRSAAQFDGAQQLFAEFVLGTQKWQTAYQKLAVDAPALSNFVTVWQDRLSATQAMLDAMQQLLIELEQE